MNKQIIIYGGGTFQPIANHLQLAAYACGKTSHQLLNLINETEHHFDIFVENTTMSREFYKPLANTKINRNIHTVDDLKNNIKNRIKNPLTKIIFMTCAVFDYKPLTVNGLEVNSEMNKSRFKTSVDTKLTIEAEPTEKILNLIRKERKDIFLVSFKTTCNATSQEMYLAGLNLLKRSSSNLVLVNDSITKNNMIITPEEASYHESTDREYVLKNLVEIALARSHLTFTRSTVIDHDLVPWNSELVPESLRTVVNYCIGKKAYKSFGDRGSTVGHFACRLSDTTFLTSIRKSNFNDLDKNGLVFVKTDGPDTVFAYGAKPSVGGQSQRIIFAEHEGYDCIVHFHCPLKKDHKDEFIVVNQRLTECGSMRCGTNSSNGMKQFGQLKAVMLDNHGPNIIFNRNIDPQIVIDFINDNFELSEKTGGYNLV